MPSPEFKSNIKNVSGNANVTICNKNLFDINSILEDPNGTLDKYETGIGATWRNKRYTEILKIRTIKAGTYKICGKQTLSNTNSGDTITFHHKDNTSTSIAIYSDYIPSEITFTKDVVAIQLFINSNKSAGDYLRIDDFMLVSTDISDVSYEEHQSQSFTFPLAEGQRLMKGDYLADDGIHHKRKQTVLDGTENWKKSNSALNGYYFSATEYLNFKANCNVKCNIATQENVVESYYNKYNAIYISTYINLNLAPDIVGSTVEEFKTYLSEQYANGTPIVIEYELAEEEIEPYTEEQQAVYDEIKKTAHSYGEQTHIFSTDEISPIFTVEARKDMNTVISNLESMIISNASEEV